MQSFKPVFSLSCFTLIKKVFSCSSLSAISVVLSAYLRLLIFLPLVIHPARRLGEELPHDAHEMAQDEAVVSHNLSV